MTGSTDPNRLTALYRLYDAAGELLYIGTSVDPENRWTQHAKDKLWWTAVARATVEWCPNRAAALAAEREAIKTECPPHNEKATPRERTYPYGGTATRGFNVGTAVRNAVAQRDKAEASVALVLDRAVRNGLALDEIAELAGLTADEVRAYGDRLVAGGGVSALRPDA